MTNRDHTDFESLRQTINRASGFSERYAWFCKYLFNKTPLFDECKKLSDGTHVTVERNKLVELTEKAWMYDDLCK